MVLVKKKKPASQPDTVCLSNKIGIIIIIKPLVPVATVVLFWCWSETVLKGIIQVDKSEISTRKRLWSRHFEHQPSSEQRANAWIKGSHWKHQFHNLFTVGIWPLSTGLTYNIISYMSNGVSVKAGSKSFNWPVNESVCTMYSRPITEVTRCRVHNLY